MPDERPSSFGQALESSGFDASASVTSTDAPDTDTAAAQSEDGSSPSTVVASDDAAPAEAAPREPSPTPEPPSGPIPFADHDRIVKGFHTKLDAATKQLEALGWAQQLPPGVGPEFVAMAQRAKGDPVGFLREFSAQIANDPRHQPALRSYYASMLGSRPASAPVAAPVDGPPPPDIEVDGHKWYSAEQQAKRDEWFTRQLADQLRPAIDERVGPLADLAQQVADARSAQQANAWADAEIAKVSKWAGFEENRADIAAYFDAEIAKFPREQQDQMAPVVLRDAYAAVVPQKLTATSGQQLLKTLTAKASASSLGTTPTVAATATRPRSMREALQQAGL